MKSRVLCELLSPSTILLVNRLGRSSGAAAPSSVRPANRPFSELLASHLKTKCFAPVARSSSAVCRCFALSPSILHHFRCFQQSILLCRCLSVFPVPLSRSSVLPCPLSPSLSAPTRALRRATRLAAFVWRVVAMATPPSPLPLTLVPRTRYCGARVG